MYAQFTEIDNGWVYKMGLCAVCSGITTITHATLTHPSTPKRQNQERPWGWVLPSTFIQCTSLPVQPVQRQTRAIGSIGFGVMVGYRGIFLFGMEQKNFEMQGYVLQRWTYSDARKIVMMGRQADKTPDLEKGVDVLKIDTQSTGFFLTAIRSRHLYNKASQWPKLRVHEDLFVLSRKRQDGG